MTTAMMCMALAIYFEARSETLVAQHMVAEVIMNRVASPKYPSEVCAVIQQDLGPNDHDCQFSFYCDGVPETIDDVVAFEKALWAGIDVITGAHERVLPTNTMWYHTKAVAPSWSGNLVHVSMSEAHHFYKE